MIERQSIGGRMATVAYLTADFLLTTSDDAAVVKIKFDDGEILFGFAQDKTNQGKTKDYSG